MQTTELSESTDAPVKASERWAGTLGVAAALGISELVAGLVTTAPSLIEGIATFVIDMVPPPVKDLAIELFGTADKQVLAVGIVGVALGLGAWAGGRSPRARAVVFGGFAVVAALAAARTPLAGLTGSFLNGAISAGAGMAVTSWLITRPVETDGGRRAFLGSAGAIAALAVLFAAGGRFLAERTRIMLAGREEVVLPAPVETVAPVASGNALDVAEISPIVTPNETFYRIDTAPLNPPLVDLATWELRITGAVGREIAFGYQDLLAMPLVERYITIACVSNTVGGDLVGNARWLGVPLADLLDEAGVREGGEQVVAESVDGFTVGFPVEAVYDGREALLAVGMNGEPLPLEHGFPARLVVSGLYGYVSATKWLSEIRLTGWDEFDAYWVPRGWAKEAPIKTQSRIDTPRHGSRVPAGPLAIAGVAWAPNRGISMVEVRVDGGEWQAAELSEPLSGDSWVQWNVPWEAAAGTHIVEVRATDGTGETQTAETAPPAPDGATGYHTITVNV